MDSGADGALTPEQVEAYDALRADLASLAASFPDATQHEAAGCWGMRLPVPHPWANQGIIRPAPGAAPATSIRFAAKTFRKVPARLYLVLDGLAAPERLTSQFTAAGWTVDAPQPYLELTAADVPAWDDAMVTRELRMPRELRHAYGVIAAAHAPPVIDGETLSALLQPGAEDTVHTVYGGVVNDAIVTTIRAVRRRTHCGLYLLATDAAHRRCGYAGAMLEQVLYLQRERGAMTFRCQPPPGAVSLCTALGFRPVGQVAVATRPAP